MIAGILAFFQAVPAIFGGINNFVNKYYDSKTQITVARIGGDVTVAKALTEGVVAEGGVKVKWLQTVSQSKFLMLIVGGFAFPIIIFMGKCILWDTVLGLGSTGPIKGQVADWMQIVISGIFVTSNVMGVGHMYFNRRS